MWSQCQSLRVINGDSSKHVTSNLIIKVSQANFHSRHHSLFSQSYRGYTTGKEQEDNIDQQTADYESLQDAEDKVAEEGQSIQDRIDELKLEIGGDKTLSAAETPADQATNDQPSVSNDNLDHPEDNHMVDSMESSSQNATSSVNADTAQKSSDEVFEEMLDKYYTKLDKDPIAVEEPSQ